MPNLVIKDMKFGQQADGGLRADATQSFYRLVNYDVIFRGDTPRLRIRPGYERWNDGVLPGKPLQLHSFTDLSQRSHLITRTDTTDKWYEARETGAHMTISSFTASEDKPVVQFGDRLFLGTDGSDADDPGMIWTDHDELYGGDSSHRLGIKPPTDPPVITSVAANGNPATPALGPIINDTTQQKIAIPYNVGVTDEKIDSIFLSVRLYDPTSEKTGSWYVRCETNDGGDPSGILVEENARTGESAVRYFGIGLHEYKRFQFDKKITLTASTVVWFIISGDEDYYDNFQDAGILSDFYGNLASNAVPNQGPVHYWDGASWNTGTFEAVWYIGGLLTTRAYGYKYTYLNSTHNIESRPSNESRSEISEENIFHVSGFLHSSDPQVDKVRIYRRYSTEIDALEDDITDEWKFVAEVNEGTAYYDSLSTENLGSYLQTTDHYCLDETVDDADEDDIGRESVIIPKCACWWKGRMWVGVSGSHKLKYSKVLEQNGATGLLGESAPDFFPLENEVEMPEPAEPVDLYPLSNDQLIVHMSNETTYVIYGGDMSMNPPPDLTMSAISQTHGLIGHRAFTPMGAKHFVLSRDGLYSYEGVGKVTPIYESAMNSSIIGDVENQYLINSRLIALANEVWILLDWDNDGDLDTILILNMEREIPEKMLFQRHWKMYQYDVKITDICSISTGDEFREIYIGDAENNYIMKVNIGTTDNENAITAWFESHDLTSRDLAMIDQIEIDPYYPDQSTIPDYDWTLIDSNDNEETGSMTNIANADDVRGHRSGVRMRRPVSVKVRISQDATKANEIRSVLISYTGE